ncbi:extracellular solute-binding protein [Bacillus sp. FJAT-27264]|uniref:extracellular solute-binding protein n=1 Tax=Paenibacillus sp. (strain DSM 101736 / FJAT-27264) TaxID=1850362 RepID=UPI00158632A5|nr:extracellular solute-binding protein [Bacillus sp. FJAT-27264]
MTKNRMVWTALLLVIVVSCVVYFRYFSQLSRFPEEKGSITEKMEVWIYSDGWKPLLEEYQAVHPEVDLSIRMFRTYDNLYEAFEAALSAHTAPQMVELENSYGLAQLIEMNALQPVAPSDASLHDSIPAIREAFVYQNRQWAVPAGISVPVLLYNQELISWGGRNDALPFDNLRSLAQSVKSWERDLENRNSKAMWEQGLGVSEGDLPLLFMNLWEHEEQSSRAERLTALLQMWHSLVYDDGVMDPLRHHLAASDFIIGKTLFYFSTSDEIPWFERYIAGNFAYGMLPLPGTALARVTPRISSFAITADTGNDEHAKNIIHYLSSVEVQGNVFQSTGYLPVHQEALAHLRQNQGLSSKYKLLFEWDDDLIIPTSAANDRYRWEAITETLHTLEVDPNADLAALQSKLLPYMP